MDGSTKHDPTDPNCIVASVEPLSFTARCPICSPRKTEEHATDVRPVMPVVARALSDDDERLREHLTLAEVREIESFTWEFSDDCGNTTIAADDLIRLCRQTLQLDRELAADRKAIGVLGAAIGVLGAAVGKVSDLHSADGAGRCRECELRFPCATALAIGAGQ